MCRHHLVVRVSLLFFFKKKKKFLQCVVQRFGFLGFLALFSLFFQVRKRNDSSDTCVASVLLLYGLVLVMVASQAELRCRRRSAH